jgi:hypothetical protein
MRHSHVEQRLFQIAATHSKSFYSAFAGPVTILNTCGDAHVEIGPDDGPKDQALPGSLIETGFGFEYGRISFERDAEDLLQSDGAGRIREGRDQN